MGDIYQRELIVYLKELHGGKFANLKVNQTKPNTQNILICYYGADPLFTEFDWMF